MYEPNQRVHERITARRYESERELRLKLEAVLHNRESQLEILAHWLELYRYRMCEIERISSCEVARKVAREAREEFYGDITARPELFKVKGVDPL